MANDQLISITTTFPTGAAAEACGRRLVELRLAACSQVEGPVTSVYRWQGGVETATEWRCICKTVPECQAACIAAITSGHDYATPQITIATLMGSPEYASWVRESVIVP